MKTLGRRVMLERREWACEIYFVFQKQNSTIKGDVLDPGSTLASANGRYGGLFKWVNAHMYARCMRVLRGDMETSSDQIRTEV